MRPEQRNEFNVVSTDAGIHIIYDPARRGSYGTSHLAFALATSKTRNPAYIAEQER
jgi:hypothetical protein